MSVLMLVLLLLLLLLLLVFLSLLVLLLCSSVVHIINFSRLVSAVLFYRDATVSSNKFSLLTVVVNSKNNSKTSNKQQKYKTDRGEMLLEPTVGAAGTELSWRALLLLLLSLLLLLMLLMLSLLLLLLCFGLWCWWSCRCC